MGDEPRHPTLTVLGVPTSEGEHSRALTPQEAQAAQEAEAGEAAEPAEVENAATSEPNLPEGGLAAVPDFVADAEPEDLVGALEAVCFALNRPLSLAEAGAVLGRSSRELAAIADVLAVQLRGRGLMLQRHHDELQLVTRPEVSWAVHRALNPEKPGRLSRPALETLAIVAYRQPCTRAAIESIRGVNCEAVLDSLERRALIAEVGRSDSPGHPRMFGTTLRFLQIVGLERIQDLPLLPAGVTVPDLGDLEVTTDFDELEPTRE